MALVNLAIDHREPQAIQQADYGIPVTRSALSAGTAWLISHDGKLVALWRLDASSFLHALRMDTLKPRAAKLRKLTPWAYLIVQGHLTIADDGTVKVNRSRTGWSWGSVIGAWMTLQEMGICVINIADGADQFVSLTTQIAARKRDAVRIEPLRDVLYPDSGELVLTDLPGIGPTRADALLTHCGGSAAWVLAALTDDTLALPGIGPKTRSAVRQALGLPDTMKLTIQMIEDSDGTGTTARPTNGHRPGRDSHGPSDYVEPADTAVANAVVIGRDSVDYGPGSGVA